MDQIRSGGWIFAGRPSATPVELAHAEPFFLAGLRVDPGLRRIDGVGASERIEPRVMQLLVALSRADGAILSRDDLLEACWDGRAVGDDAINRVVSRLRKTLNALAGPAVTVETIARVGYRLVIEEPATGAGAAQADPSVTPGRIEKRSSLKMRGAGLAALAAGVAAIAWLSVRPDPAAATTRIAIEAVAGAANDREARRFASDLTGDFARLASANSRVDVVDRTEAGGRGDNDFVMRISVGRDAGRLAATARLVAAEDGAVLWSRAYVDETGSAARLRERVAVSSAGLVRCGLERSTKVGDSALLRLFFAACDAIEDRDWSRAESFARQAVELRPDSASGWACLAMTTLLVSGYGDKSAAGDAHRRRAVAYARKALSLDPQVGRAYMVLAGVGQPDPRALAVLEAGIRADSEMPELHRIYSMNLFNLGYVEASVASALRALALDPTSLGGYELAWRRLMTAGRIEDALAMQARAERIWPDSPSLLQHRLRFLPYLPDPRDALAQFDRIKRGATPQGGPPDLTEDILRWRVNPASLDRAALDRKAEAMFRDDPLSAWYLAWAMEVMGEPKRALAWLARAPKRNASMQWSLLFSADVAGLRRDPRFFAAMAELGLVDQWRQSGRWPDFCAEPSLRYDCKAEAARLRPDVA